MFDDNKARRFIEGNFEHAHVIAFDRCYHPAMRCDFFRLCYILRHGGFYVDADEVYKGAGCEFLFQDAKVKLQPLCYDLSTNQMVPPDGLGSGLARMTLLGAVLSQFAFQIPSLKTESHTSPTKPSTVG